MSCLTDVQVSWLVQGGSTDDSERGALVDHVASCASCHALVSESMTSSTDEPLCFGRYEMLRAVAGGGMGTVFCAYDPVLRRLVAIKIIANADHDRRERDQMLEEARALASLRHENVVALHDVGIIDDEMFLAMEFVEGASLQVEVHRIVSDVARLAILADVTRGLAAIHAAGLVHRDLKPSNVMITPAGRAVLLDLGLAAAHGAAGTAAGSPGFIAPEVRAGRPATAASDQYAWWRVVDELFAASRLPPRSRAALTAASARGRAPDPARRYPSIDHAFTAVRDLVQPRRPRRALAAWVALTALVASVAVLAAVRAARQDAVVTCARVDGWDAATRAQVQTIVGRHDFDAARVITALDEKHASVERLLGAACAEAPSIERDRTRVCLGLVWREDVRALQTIARDVSRDRVATALDGLARVLPAERCRGRTPLSLAPAITRAQAATYSDVANQIDAAAQQTGKPSIAALDALRPAVERNGYAGLQLRWSSQLVRELVFAGDYKRARIEVEAARHLAQVSGDDVQLGWASVAQLRVATALHTDTDEMEADVEAIVARVDSPLLAAEALQARAERAYRDGKPQLVVDLLTRAIALYTEVSLIPSPGLRTAYNTKANALQQLGKLEEARGEIDRAVAVAKQRFAPTSAELEESLAARANNLLYLGQIDEAGEEFQRLYEALAAAHREGTATGVRIQVALCQIEMVRRTERVIPLCEATIAAGAALYGAESPELISVRNILAQYLVERDAPKAIVLLEETLRIGAHGSTEPLDVPYAQALLALGYNEVKRHADGCVQAARSLAVLRTSPQVEMVRTLERYFPELTAGGRCRR